MKIDKQTALHYSWGEGCDGWPLVESEGLSVKQERMPAGSSEKWHLHRRSQQVFYILEGESRFLLEGTSFRLKAGGGLR